MSKPSFKLILRKEKENKKGLSPLYIRITHQRKSTFKYLDIKIKKEDWNVTSQKVKNTHPNSTRLNNYLNKVLVDYENAYLKRLGQGQFISSRSIKESVIRIESIDFIDFFKSHLKSRLDQKKYGTHDKEKVIFNKLKDFIKKEELNIHEIDVNFLDSFGDHLRNFHKNKTNTIHGNFRILRMLLNKAEIKNYIKHENNPFRNYKLEREETHRVYLTEKEIKKIRKLKIDPNTKMFHHREMFIFACYACGLRISDLLTLKWSNIEDDHVEVIMQKTNKTLRFKLLKKARKILKSYSDRKNETFVFPFLNSHVEDDQKELYRQISSCTAYYNKDLKKIAEKCKIEKNLSSHIARHTFATIALKQGVKIEYVSKLLGHSSIKTTQIYSKIIDAELDKAMDKLKF